MEQQDPTADVTVTTEPAVRVDHLQVTGPRAGPERAIQQSEPHAEFYFVFNLLGSSLKAPHGGALTSLALVLRAGLLFSKLREPQADGPTRGSWGENRGGPWVCEAGAGRGN